MSCSSIPFSHPADNNNNRLCFEALHRSGADMDQELQACSTRMKQAASIVADLRLYMCQTPVPVPSRLIRMFRACRCRPACLDWPECACFNRLPSLHSRCRCVCVGVRARARWRVLVDLLGATEAVLHERFCALPVDDPGRAFVFQELGGSEWTLHVYVPVVGWEWVVSVSWRGDALGVCVCVVVWCVHVGPYVWLCFGTRRNGDRSLLMCL